MELRKIGEALWEMPKHDRMKVPAHIVATEKMLPTLQKDKTLWQLKNVASLEGILEKAVLMPDAHQGYGFPIGGVAAFDAEEGIVSPGGIGYDINCGVRLLLTPLRQEDVRGKERELAEEIFRLVPAGVGRSGKLRLSKEELDEVARMGIDWALEKGYAWERDKDHMEEYGRMEGADPSKVSERAKARGRDQLGTLGAGNHFLEIQVVEKLLSPEVAEAFGLEPGQVVVMIHSGSRGYGHQIASDYIKTFMKRSRREGLWLPDPELVYGKLEWSEAQDYLKAMRSAVNFAFVNRQLITYWTREAFAKVFSPSVAEEMPLLYDVAHNIAKFEEHTVYGKKRRVIVHRKGATRAFPAGREEVPVAYRSTGQPVLIPGSMGTASYVLVGLPSSMEVSFGSSCHGAGRQKSRRQAKREHRGEELVRELAEKGIWVRPASFVVAAEEAPDAYKDVDEVVKSVEKAGISRIVARLKPVAVVKG